MLSPAVAANERPIDPFGYWPDLASAIAGIKDGQRSDDRNYVFHSEYLAYPFGSNSFEIVFKGLRAQQGVLNIRVFSFSESRGRLIEQVAAMEIGLPRLAKRRRPVAIAFEAAADCIYAVSGYLLGDTDAVADGMEIRSVEGTRLNEDHVGSARSFLGSGMARRVDTMTSDTAATLAFPVSQGFTLAQTREAIFDVWVNEARCQGADLRAMWETAYVLQVLSSYGRLTPGAFGLGIGLENSAIASVAQARGCTVRQIAASPIGPFEADKDEDEDVSSLDSSRQADFLWSPSDRLRRCHRQLVWQYIDDQLDLLAPAGLGVFMLPVTNVFRPPGAAQCDTLDLHDVRRLMLNIVSAGHIVSQLRHDHFHEHRDLPITDTLSQDDQIIPIGLIVRKFAADTRES